ncbi:hypothetical protein [Marinimicrobium sp. C2-29]
MKTTITTFFVLLLISGCTSTLGPDHYFCNQHESREDYEVCMEAGEEVE